MAEQRTVENAIVLGAVENAPSDLEATALRIVGRRDNIAAANMQQLQMGVLDRVREALELEAAGPDFIFRIEQQEAVP